MDHNELVKQQFNSQAKHFDNWEIAKNIEYLKGISEFISFMSNDTLLDVATGPGDFPLFIASQIKNAIGIDISNKMIEIANTKKTQKALKNIEFKVSDVEHLPFADNSFSVVASKAAFHHMPNYATVFNEMNRCCQNNGKISLCDILAFEDPLVDIFFERFEKIVDASHYKTLSRSEFIDLFNTNGINIERQFEIDIEHSLAEYLSHSIQTEDALKELENLLIEAMETNKIKDFWTFGEGKEEIKFRRKVILLLGKK